MERTKKMPSAKILAAAAISASVTIGILVWIDQPAPKAIPAASQSDVSTIVGYAKSLPHVFGAYWRAQDGRYLPDSEIGQFFYVDIAGAESDPLTDALPAIKAVLRWESEHRTTAKSTNIYISSTERDVFSSPDLLGLSFSNEYVDQISASTLSDADLLNHASQVVFNAYGEHGRDERGEKALTNYCERNANAAVEFCQRVEARKVALANMDRGIFPKDTD
ncbi:MAG: hypothetical protein ACLQO1_05450 [Steroidobacteraceae bacterium]